MHLKVVAPYRLLPMITETSKQPSLVARWAVLTATLDDAQQARVSLRLIPDLLEQFERGGHELRADVLRIMDRALEDAARTVPVTRVDDAPDVRPRGHRRHWIARRDPKHGHA